MVGPSCQLGTVAANVRGLAVALPGYGSSMQDEDKAGRGAPRVQITSIVCIAVSNDQVGIRSIQNTMLSCRGHISHHTGKGPWLLANVASLASSCTWIMLPRLVQCPVSCRPTGTASFQSDECMCTWSCPATRPLTWSVARADQQCLPAQTWLCSRPGHRTPPAAP